MEIVLDGRGKKSPLKLRIEKTYIRTIRTYNLLARRSCFNVYRKNCKKR